MPAFAPPAGLAPGEYRMQQVDVERSQEFRKCIECFLCQNTCHVIRDHEENKEAFAGPARVHPGRRARHAPAGRADRPQGVRARRSRAWVCCNITKCCTEVCPEHIKITDNAIIPMKERVVDNRYDPLVWLGRKIFRRDQLPAQRRCRRTRRTSRRHADMGERVVPRGVAWHAPAAGRAARRGRRRTASCRSPRSPSTGPARRRRSATTSPSRCQPTQPDVPAPPTTATPTALATTDPVVPIMICGS